MSQKSQAKGSNSKQLNEEVYHILKVAFKNNVFEYKQYVATYRKIQKKKRITKEQFRRGLLRNILLENFQLFLYTLGFDLWENPRYKEIIETWTTSETMISALMQPRGTMKSVLFISAFSLWLYIRESIMLKQSPTILMAHEDIKKAAENVEKVRIYMQEPIIQWIFGDKLKANINSREAIKLEDESNIKAKESHFQAGSTKSIPTGRHFTYIMADDWVTPENTSTESKNEENKRAFWSLMSLDDHHGRFKIYVVGTEYGDDSLYQDLKKKGATYISVPVAEEVIVSGNRCEVINPYFPEKIPEEKIKEYFSFMPRKQFFSQYMMQPYQRGVGTKMCDSLPDWSEPTSIARTVITVDPAISAKNKSSQAVIIVSKIGVDGKIYVEESWAANGIRMTAFVRRIFHYLEKHQADIVIIENIAYQEALVQAVEDERISTGLTFRLIRHRHYESKEEHYRAFLEPIIDTDRLLVHPNNKELIAQLTGNSNLNDFVDCLAFLKEININAASKIFKQTKKDKPLKRPRRFGRMAYH